VVVVVVVVVVWWWWWSAAHAARRLAGLGAAQSATTNASKTPGSGRNVAQFLYRDADAVGYARAAWPYPDR